MWKFCSWIYTMCLWWEIIITVCFWGVLLPTTNFGEEFYGRPWGEFKLMTDHIFPLFFLLCDWILDGFYFEKSHIWPNLIPMTIYGIVNFSVVTATGVNVYPGLNWSNWLGWGLVVFAYPACIGIWLALCWCSNKKLHRVVKNEILIDDA
jgi:hypothetical protein